VRGDIAEAVLDDSELIGFWVAWHQAGGFAHLESGGWHRATIFRKIRKFRTRFGAHPDEYTFPWIKLDLKRSWSDDLSRNPDQSRSPKRPRISTPFPRQSSRRSQAPQIPEALTWSF
jgi:hypothetical protein